MSNEKKTPASLAAVKNEADAKEVKGVTAAKVEGTVTDEPDEVEVELAPVEGMVQVKNIVKANVFTSKGKIPPGGVANVSESDAKALKEKELCIEV